MDDQQTNNTNINMQSAPVNPQQNVATSSALDERISQQPQSKKSSKSKIIIFVFLILFLVLVGVGGWWYYAQGQAWLMLKQSSWNWGVDALENYQQDTSLYLSISTKTKEGQSDAYFMFPGDQKFYIDLTSSQKNISQNMEADTTLTAKGENFDLNVGFKSKKIDDKVYLSLNLGNLSELAAGMIALPDFGDIWFEMDVENSYNITLDKEKLAQVNIKFNDFLDKLKSDGIFDIKDLKNDDNGFRKIQLNVKENKIDDFVLAAINYGADVYEVVSDVDTNSSEYKDYRQSNIQIFEDLKNEKPADWEKIKKIFESIDFVILLNENTKAIHGLEIYLNNIISDDNSLSTIINGNIKYFIKSIDAYDIVKPNNIKSIDNFQDIFTSSTMDIDEYNGPLLTPDDPGFYDNHTIDKIDSDSDGLSDMLESIYGTDINNPDTDGDGYTDGEEVDNGYNPLGEGLISLPPPSYDDWGMNDISNVDLNLDTEPLRSEQVCYFTGGQWLSDSYTSEFYCLCPGDIKKGPLDAYSFLGCD